MVWNTRYMGIALDDLRSDGLQINPEDIERLSTLLHHQIRLDGRYHFTLPDGDFAIPIVAQSPDKVERRSATLSFVRGTSRAGEVGATAQPAELSPLIGKK